MTKYKELFQCGQVWRSKEYPEKDFLIDSVCYHRSSENAYDFNLFSYICWQIANEEAFDKKVCEFKKVSSIDELKEKGMNTFPFASFGDNKPKSLQQKIKKYNMYLDETRKYISNYKNDNEWEYSEAIGVGVKKFLIDYECKDGIYIT